MTRWLALLVLICTVAAPAAADELRGRVVGVSDGDTITVLVDSHQQHRIRLAEIDAPELRQPYGQKAKQALSTLVFAKDIRVITSGKDRYGRLIGRAYAPGMPHELDVSAQMVQDGAAWVFTRYATDPSLYDLQTEARIASRGLWALPLADQVPPWDWRRSRTTAQQQP